MKKLTVWFLCSILVLMPVMSRQIQAKTLFKLNLADTERQNKIKELSQAIEKIQQNKALPDDVRRDSLEELLKELTPLLQAEIGYLEGQRDAFVATETNEIAKNTVKKSFDKNIQHWKDVLGKATLEKLLAGTQIGADKPKPKDEDSKKEKKSDDDKKTDEDESKKVKAKIKIVDVPEVGDEFVSAVVENADSGKHRLQFILSGTEGDLGKMPATGNGSSITSNKIAGGLKFGQIVTYRLIDDKDNKVTEVSVNVFGKTNPTDSGLFGLLFSGLVTTRQAQTTNEAAPFLGFQIGWGSKVSGITKDAKEANFIFMPTCADEDKAGDDWEVSYNLLQNATNKKVYQRVEDGDFNINNDSYRELGKTDGCEIKFGYKVGKNDKKKRFSPLTGRETTRWSYRFQGLFSNEARTATAEITDNPLPAGQPGTPFRFLQHRQSFSPEFTVWREWNPLGQFSYGIYGTVGATTALDSNEANDQLVVDRRTNRRVKVNVVSSGGLKFFGEIGSIQHLKFNPGRFLLQNFFGVGYYEAFRGSAFKFGTETPDGLTRFRLVNKLRIFPEGINVDFGRQITMTPMFGYDLNTGLRGPSNVRFFTGFAIKLKGFDGKTVEDK